jgi:hypothetical protein
MPRVVIGVLLFASFLYFFFTYPHTVITGILFVCFLALVMNSLITHWLLMQDSMKLQDLKHSRQTDHSDIS